MGTTIPGWLTPLAWIVLTLAVVSAALIAADIYGRGHRLSSTADELVWIGSGLYLGPLAVALHLRHRRATGTPATLPGGTASVAAHLVGVPLVIASGLTIAGIDLWVMILVIAVLAVLLLLAHDRITYRTSTIGAALAAAVLTVVAFDLGMGGWMLLLHFTGFMPPATDAGFWLLMEIGILLGLLTGYPAVTWLNRRTRPA